MAQQPAAIIDSLRTRLAMLPADTSRVQVLDELCWQLSSSDLKQATAYGKQGLALARQLNYRRGQLKCLNDLGNCASYASDFLAGTRYFLEAQRLARQAPVQLDILGFAYNGLANLHTSQREFAEAQQNLEQALELTHQTHSAADQALFSGSLGNVMRLRKQYPASEQYLRKSLALYDSLKNQMGQAFCLGQLASLYHDQGQWSSTRRYAQQALAVSKAIGHEYYMGVNLDLLGDVELKTDNLPLAQSDIEQSLTYARRTGNGEIIADGYQTLAQIFAKRGDYLQAYQWQKRFQTTRDSLVTSEKNNEIATLRVRSDTEQKEAHIRELTHQSQVQQLRAEQERSRLLALLLGMVALALAGGGTLLYLNQRRRLARILHEERLRNRIAADLHDDVGTLLTRVTMQAELLQDSSEGTASTLALNRLVANSRAAASTMRDVVWSIDAQSDTIGALADRMRDYLDQLSPSYLTDLQLDESLTGNLPLPPELRQPLYLIFKEAVTNVVRHARQASCLVVRLRREGRLLLLEVEDDGQPNATPVGRSGLGLRSMSQRAKALNGQLEVGPLPGQGYRVRLGVPFK